MPGGLRLDIPLGKALHGMASATVFTGAYVVGLQRDGCVDCPHFCQRRATLYRIDTHAQGSRRVTISSERPRPFEAAKGRRIQRT